MTVSRREFAIACLAGLGASRVAGFTTTAPAPPTRLHIIGRRGRNGAALAIDEMTRTAALLGRQIEIADRDGALVLDVDAGILRDGAVYHVAASDAARRAALAAWGAIHAGAADGAVEWHACLVRYGAEQLNDRFTRAFAAPMQAADWIGWMLVKIAVETELRGVPVGNGHFDGHKGEPLSFDADRHLRQPLCIVDVQGQFLGVQAA